MSNFNQNEYLRLYFKNKVKKQILNTDFEKLVERKDGHYKMINGNKMLISASNLLRIVSEYKMYGIPNQVLERKREHGSSVMRILKELFENRIEDMSFVIGSLNDKFTVQAILDYLAENKFKVLAVDKLVTDGHWVGIIDLFVKRQDGTICIVEIKTRNEFEVRLSDYVQCELYYRLCGVPPTYLLVVDKQNKVTMHEMNFQAEENKKRHKNTYFQGLMYLYCDLMGIPKIKTPSFLNLEENKNGE